MGNSRRSYFTPPFSPLFSMLGSGALAAVTGLGIVSFSHFMTAYHQAKETMSLRHEQAKSLTLTQEQGRKIQELQVLLSDQQKLLKEYEAAEEAGDLPATDLVQRTIAALDSAFKKEKIAIEFHSKGREIVFQLPDVLFGLGQTTLDPKARASLMKAVKLLSHQLFETQGLDKQIDSVEIMGLTLPTHQGRWTTPELAPREAHDVGVRLSFLRAKTIYDSIISPQSGNWPRRAHFLNRLKMNVSGFRTIGTNRKLASVDPGKPFCKQVSCDEYQRATFRIELKGVH